MNTFKSTGAKTIGLTKTTVYTVPASTVTTVIGLSVANVLTTETLVKADVILSKGATEYYIVRGANIMPGESLVAVGGDQKVILEAGNTIKIVSTVASSLDVIVSMLEIT